MLNIFKKKPKQTNQLLETIKKDLPSEVVSLEDANTVRYYFLNEDYIHNLIDKVVDTTEDERNNCIQYLSSLLAQYNAKVTYDMRFLDIYIKSHVQDLSLNTLRRLRDFAKDHADTVSTTIERLSRLIVVISTYNKQ